MQPVVTATSQLVTRSSHHMVMSSHGQLVTGQLVTHASRHKVNSPQASTKQNHQYTVVIICTPSGEIQKQCWTQTA